MAACGVYVLHVLALLAVVVSADYVLKPEFAWQAEDELIGYQGSGSASASGTQPPFQLVNVTVPVCREDQFLTSNGTHLLCRRLPDPICDCPTQPEGIPLPPAGCPILQPPIRGAFVCLRNPNIIYCTVLCDHRFEFSSTPLNPYFCGNTTNFQWMDFSGKIHDELPRCTDCLFGSLVRLQGFRHRLRLLHPARFYLPAPCYGLSDQTTLAIMWETHDSVTSLGCTDCDIRNVYLQCPSVMASALSYDEVKSAVLGSGPFHKNVLH